MKKGNAYAIMMVVLMLFGVFFLYPAAKIVGEAFWNKDSGFTLEYLVTVCREPVYVEGLWNAFLLGLVSTVATLLLSFPLALLTHKYDFKGKKILGVLVLIPLILPPFVGAVGIKEMLGVDGAFNALLIDSGLMDGATL